MQHPSITERLRTAEPSGHVTSPKSFRDVFDTKRWMIVLSTFVVDLHGTARNRNLCVLHAPYLQRKCTPLCWSQQCDGYNLLDFGMLLEVESHCTAHFGNLLCRHRRELYLTRTLHFFSNRVPSHGKDVCQALPEDLNSPLQHRPSFSGR